MEELWVPSLVPAARGRPKNVPLVRFDDISSDEEDEELNIDEFAQNVDSYFSSLPPDATLELPHSEPTDFARLMESMPMNPVKVNTPTVLHTQQPAAAVPSPASPAEKEAAQKAYNDVMEERRKRHKKEMRQEELDTYFMYGMITGVFVVSAGVFAYYMLSKQKPAVTEAATQAAALPPRPQMPRMRSVAPAYY